MTQIHHIKTDIFEGPLELLLDLIERQKLSINEVSLAAIADEYVGVVKARAAVRPDEISNFLVVASMLMLIKSRSLLPHMPISDEEEISIQNLENRLEQLRRMRELSRHIAAYAASGNHMYGRSGSADLPTLFYPPEGISPPVLHAGIRALTQALSSYTQKMKLPEKAIMSVISLEEKIRELMERVEKSLTSFRAFVGSVKEKTEIIVSFLALLELVKQGHIAVKQSAHFGDIKISSQK